MRIKTLKLRNYRNYDCLELNFSGQLNVIYGNNGQGKTNILEAVFLCSSGRSHRTSKDQELIKIGEETFSVTLDMEKDDSLSIIEMQLRKNEKKKIRINELPVKRLGDLMGHLNTVIFSPEDLLIIKEGPSERRRFIDITISQLKPSYFYDLQQYIKILSQRNMLLKEIQEKNTLKDTLDIWNENLADTGARIMKVRQEFLKRISSEAEKNHYNLTNGTEKLSLKYFPSVRNDDILDVKEIKKLFIQVLEKNQGREIYRGVSLYGPHRDDYELFLNDTSLKNFGSQGQQRTSILSIKLSEVAIMQQETGEYPVLLLDDVMSELDSYRQEYLIKNLDNIQTFVTCTDKAIFDKYALPNTGIFHVIGGTVS